MALVSREVLVEVPPERFYAVVRDFARYPEFVPTVKSCRERRVADAVEVDYELDLGLKTVRYTLRLAEDPPLRMSWTLLRSDWMSVSSGSWELAGEGGRTRAVYAVDIQVRKPPLVPQSLVDRITDELTRVQLPRMLEAFKRRAEGR
ncbi:MAG TPA: SRPBCC family protein [Anaeromyxobacteraceae bacterium]|jgi:ribosome-associated toxin RatA of RatAB toxin-antitoxin module